MLSILDHHTLYIGRARKRMGHAKKTFLGMTYIMMWLFIMNDNLY